MALQRVLVMPKRAGYIVPVTDKYCKPVESNRWHLGLALPCLLFCHFHGRAWPDEPHFGTEVCCSPSHLFLAGWPLILLVGIVFILVC